MTSVLSDWKHLRTVLRPFDTVCRLETAHVYQVLFEDASPADPQVQEYMIALLEELAAEHINVISGLSEEEMATYLPKESSSSAV